MSVSAGEPGPRSLFRLAWGFYLVMAVAGVLWVGLSQGDIPFSLFVDPASWWLDLGLGAAAGLALIGLWQLGRRWLSGAAHLETQLAGLLAGLDDGGVLGLAALSGFAEELFFRGAVQGAWGLVPATALFALLHLGPGGGGPGRGGSGGGGPGGGSGSARSFPLWTAFAAIAGLLLGGLMLWRGNLLAPVTAHFLVNAVNLRRLARHPPAADPGAG